MRKQKSTAKDVIGEQYMGYYKLLSRPVDNIETNKEYKGLYRLEPSPGSELNKRFMSLWYRYVEYYESLKNWGITTELSLDELKELAELATHETGDNYELIYFSEYEDCPHKAEYYGADVTGVGGYSMVGEGFNSTGGSQVFCIICQYFREKLNAYGLFSTHDDAMLYRDALLELDKSGLDCIEQEDWRVFHIYKVI